jgi:hypothetical protein
MPLPLLPIGVSTKHLHSSAPSLDTRHSALSAVALIKLEKTRTGLREVAHDHDQDKSGRVTKLWLAPHTLDGPCVWRGEHLVRAMKKGLSTQPCSRIVEDALAIAPFSQQQAF